MSLIFKDNNFQLRNVQLKGYKTIKDVSISFQRGLNIIIGKNGTGKTNFVEFLQDTLRTSDNPQSLKLPDGYSFLQLENDNQELLKINIQYKRNQSSKRLTHEKIYEPLFNKQTVNTYPSNFHLISYNYPTTFPIAKIPISLETFHDYIDSPSAFSEQLIWNLIHIREIGMDRLKAFVQEDEIFEELQDSLIRFTNIMGIRFSPNVRIYETIYLTKVENIYLEFKIEGEWLPFSSLSDGTKRMFYIIADVLFSQLDYNSEYNTIILLEEPELGIHPHQLTLLLQFLKEQAENQQIIITTHSPQVLNLLGKDDLDRLIITSLENRGTKMRHLTATEKEHAKLYMEEMYLSDYWVYSDLEEE